MKRPILPVLRFSILLLLGAALLACSTVESRNRAAENAKRVSIHTQLAAGHLMRNQVEFALQEVNKALAVDDGDSQANNMMALIQQRLYNESKAERHFQKALSSDATNSEAHNNYAVFLCEHGRAKDAIAHFDAALSNPLYRSQEKASLNAGLCLLRSPVKGLSAEKYFRNALKVNPRSVMGLYNMARISYASGQLFAARGFMQRFFEIAPDSPESLLLAVKVEKALGAKDTEAGYALRLRGKFPNSDEARQLVKITGR